MTEFTAAALLLYICFIAPPNGAADAAAAIRAQHNIRVSGRVQSFFLRFTYCRVSALCVCDAINAPHIRTPPDAAAAPPPHLFVSYVCTLYTRAERTHILPALPHQFATHAYSYAGGLHSTVRTPRWLSRGLLIQGNNRMCVCERVRAGDVWDQRVQCLHHQAIIARADANNREKYRKICSVVCPAADCGRQYYTHTYVLFARACARDAAFAFRIKLTHSQHASPKPMHAHTPRTHARSHSISGLLAARKCACVNCGCVRACVCWSVQLRTRTTDSSLHTARLCV